MVDDGYYYLMNSMCPILIMVAKFWRESFYLRTTCSLSKGNKSISPISMFRCIAWLWNTFVWLAVSGRWLYALLMALDLSTVSDSQLEELTNQPNYLLVSADAILQPGTSEILFQVSGCGVCRHLFLSVVIGQDSSLPSRHFYSAFNPPHWLIINYRGNQT